MKNFFLLTLIFTGLCGAWGQSNRILDEFLNQEYADTATAMMLVAQASGQLPLEAEPQKGYQWAAEQEFGKWFRANSPETPVSLGQFYLALLSAQEFTGGLLFRSVRTPRLAVQEASFMGLIEPSNIYYTRFMPPYEVLTAISAMPVPGEVSE